MGADQMSPDERRALLAECRVVRTAKNSHIVWQILAADGRCVQGPPREFRGQMIGGQMGWKLKREAAVAVCVDDYGNQVFATTAGYARPHRAYCHHI